jgi:hypothetical protein
MLEKTRRVFTEVDDKKGKSLAKLRYKLKTQNRSNSHEDGEQGSLRDRDDRTRLLR